jgi:hypothetical protein
MLLAVLIRAARRLRDLVGAEHTLFLITPTIESGNFFLDSCFRRRRRRVHREGEAIYTTGRHIYKDVKVRRELTDSNVQSRVGRYICNQGTCTGRELNEMWFDWSTRRLWNGGFIILTIINSDILRQLVCEDGYKYLSTCELKARATREL